MKCSDEMRVGDTVVVVVQPTTAAWCGTVIEVKKEAIVLGPPEGVLRARGDAIRDEWKITRSLISAWRRLD